MNPSVSDRCAPAVAIAGPEPQSRTPFKGMYVLVVQLGSENVATPIAVTNGTTWQ